MIDFFAKISETKQWKLAAYLVGASLIALTLYDEFIKNKNPDYSVNIISNYDVLDIKENISDLKILVGDIDIKNVKKNLSIVVLKIQNNGGASITKDHYDSEAMPTIQLLNGEILKAERTDASNDYLLNTTFAPKILGNTIITPAVILDPNDFYMLKILVLHLQNQKPSISITGKLLALKV